jgi:hypothetical protein
MFKKMRPCWVWWCKPVSLALRRLRQENLELEVSLGYIARLCLQKQRKIKENHSS